MVRNSAKRKSANMKILKYLFFLHIYILAFNGVLKAENSNELYKKIDLFSEVLEKINDDYIFASKFNVEGCHIGQLDGSVKLAKKKLKNKILGVTCHNSKILAKKAIKDKASYIAFGSFFKSGLKPNAKKANQTILKWSKKNIKKPIVVIGGINNLNYKKLIKSGAKYIALSSFIWDNPKLKPEIAIRKFK